MQLRDAFKTATRSGPGAYELELDDKQDGRKLDIQVTPYSLVGGVIQAAPVSQGDTRHIQITNFNTSGVAADTALREARVTFGRETAGTGGPPSSPCSVAWIATRAAPVQDPPAWPPRCGRFA